MKIKSEVTIVLVLIALAISVSSLGCLGGGNTVGNETKLDVTEGVGIVGSLKIAELNPGLDGYLSLTTRSNLAGESAYNVIISLDNVYPFQIFECGTNQSPNSPRTCSGQFDMDRGLLYREHGLSKMFPGEEDDVYWRLRAPSSDEISEIALKHPIYYDLEYTYHTSFHQNIIAMSLQEVTRKRQAGETWQVSGESGMGAGELRVTGITPQPIIYQFAGDAGSEHTENPFVFTYEFNVENKGNGVPVSDVVIILQYPEGIDPAGNAKSEYHWSSWNDTTFTNLNCSVSILSSGGDPQNCPTWINKSFGDDFSMIMPKGVTNPRILVRIINRTDFIKQFPLQAPLQITASELEGLREANTPLKVYTFKAYVLYRYFTEGKEYITVYPLKVK